MGELLVETERRAAEYLVAEVSSQALSAGVPTGLVDRMVRRSNVGKEVEDDEWREVEAARLAKEEAEREAREKAEREAREEAERIAAAEEAERIAREEASIA